MLNPGDRAKRSEVLRKLLISLSTQGKISDESFEQMAKDVEFIYRTFDTHLRIDF